MKKQIKKGIGSGVPILFLNFFIIFLNCANLLAQSKIITSYLKAPGYIHEIKEINIEEYLTKDGYFTEKSLAQFLEKAYKNKVLSHTDFSSVTCMHIKDIHKISIATGSRQLFLVKSTCTAYTEKEYLIKDLKYKNEAIELCISLGIQELKQFIHPQSKNIDYPTLIFPEIFISYIYKNIEHVLCFIPKADGILLLHLLQNYCKDPSFSSKNLIINACQNISKSLANFHKYFMEKNSLKSVIHGDFHPANILYNEKTKISYFIDNQHIGKYFYNKESIIKDLKKFLRWSFYIIEMYNSEICTKERLQYIVFKEFIHEYIGAYEIKKQNQILETMIKSINDRDWYHHSLTKKAQEKNKQLLKEILNAQLKN